MPETQAAVKQKLTPTVVEVQLKNSKTNAGRFALLLLPLALLLVLFKVYALEQPAFFTLSCLVFGGFAVSYWLPFRFKEPFAILLSFSGAVVLLSPLSAGLLISVGLLMFAVIRTGLEFRWKVILLLAVLALFIYGRASGLPGVPLEFWAVFGSVFIFRMIVYLYDISHKPGPVSLRDYLSYFFLLPNYYFLLFPVVDFQTFRKSYFKRDIHAVAQQGVWWIFRGATHLLLYRVIYQSQAAVSPPRFPVFAAVILKSVFSYLLILRITGQFHIAIGMLHLFGYDLPPNSRYFLLANSFIDFWRRVSIYWKDFMVKIIYFPAYFKMRKTGDLRAQLLATVLVFVVTWFLHAFQFFFMQGRAHFSWNDTLFWTILGTLVVANVWIDAKRRKRLPASGWIPGVKNSLQIAATFATISLLWSMWSASSMDEWFYFLRSGNVG